MAFPSPLAWREPLDRGPYALVGVSLFAVKYLADRFVSEVVFSRPWDLGDYLDVSGVGRITSLTAEAQAYTLSLVALALPFIAVGTGLTVRRLRSLGLPLWLVVLFFVPVVDLVFFAALSLVPSRETEPPGPGAPTWLERLVPESKLGAAAVACLVTVAGSLVLVWVSVDWLASYGWGLFVGVPFALGLAASLLYEVHEPRSARESFGVATTAVLLLSGALAVLAIEGLICLVMAAPLSFALAWLGALFGHLFSRAGAAAGRPALWAVAVVPALVGAEAAAPPRASLLPVRTAIEIAAPPEVVWERVVSFAELPPPTDWVFATGVAYPVRGTIEGAGVGAVRRCEFTTGTFVEPITVWEPGRRLAFSVASQPSPMQEVGLFGRVEPRHLNGYFVSERGQFLLTPLAGGGTRLEGTTWYRHRIWPSAYWRLWSDAVLHRIHGRVLRHVRALAEADVAG